MALSGLTPRQETAARLCRELQAFGANVTSVLPLADGQHLRFWIDDYKKKEVLQQLADAGYEPIFLKMDFQPDIRSYSIGLVNSFELPIAADREPIIDDRVVPKDDASRRAKDSEREAMLQHIYGKQRR